MSKKERRMIKSKVLSDVSKLGQITKEQLLRESEQYDKENYDPLADLTEKVVVRPHNRNEVITIRLTQEENNLLTDMAKRNKISRSALVRMLITRYLKKLDI